MGYQKILTNNEVRGKNEDALILHFLHLVNKKMLMGPRQEISPCRESQLPQAAKNNDIQA
jgi:hypothetical protein